MKQPRQTREKSQFQIDTEKTILHANEQQAEIEKLRKERDEWKAKYEELATKAPEEAFNAQTGLPCTIPAAGTVLAAGTDYNV